MGKTFLVSLLASISKAAFTNINTGAAVKKAGGTYKLVTGYSSISVNVLSDSSGTLEVQFGE